MKVFIFISAIQYCFLTNNFLSVLNDYNLTFINEITKPVRKVESIINSTKSDLFFLMLFKNPSFMGKGFDDKCISFLNNIYESPKDTLNILAKKYMRDGFGSNTIEAEEECLNKDDVYILAKLEYSKSPIYDNYSIYKNQHILFIESFISDWELCLSSICKNFYINQYKKIFGDISDNICKLFELDNFTIVGINYKINETTNYYDKYEDNNKNFNKRIKIFFWFIFFILIICTSYSLWKENKDEYEEEDNKHKKDKLNKKNYKKIDDARSEKTKSEITLFSKSPNENETFKYKLFKLCKSFNFVNNFFLLNKKKDPLSNQNSLTELSTIICIILFFILLAENTFIIIKYIDNGMTLIYFLKNWSFVFIKIGCVSYEFYKIICGVIFGYKFINYYKKSENYNVKNILKFLFKFIPYFISFLIIYFILQYHSVEFVSYMKNSLRNKYLSKKMNNCYYCHKEFYNIFNPLMLGKYNSTESYAAQYDGCLRTTLFTACEFICYLFIILLFSIFLKIKKELYEIIFFIIILLLLPMAYILTPEGMDLEYFTLSRLFGLSASISLPYLFFPLYYIGFNIGIIYYYNQHQSEAYNELNEKENNYIPFKYCFRLSLFLRGINEKIKNLIIALCFIFIFIILLSFTFVIRHEDKLYFKFNSFTKFMYVYEGILCGIFFSIFIVIYLSLNSESTLRIVISSETLFFINKISFVLFNMIIPSLKIFYGINTVGIVLSTVNLFLTTISLYIIISFMAVLFAISILYSIKWIYFFIIKGFNYDEYE